MHTKSQIMTHHYQAYSISQCLLGSARSSSTTVIKWPHNKVDSIFTQNYLKIQGTKIANSHTHKHYHMHDSSHIFFDQYLFQLTQDYKGLYKSCNGSEYKYMVKVGYSNEQTLHEDYGWYINMSKLLKFFSRKG